MHIQHVRKEYGSTPLERYHLKDDPIDQFSHWFQNAIYAGIQEPNAMALATCDHDRPTNRMVLLKQWDAKGFVFFTNYTSRKGIQLEHSHHAAATIYWHDLERQVCIEGCIEKTSQEESETYFQMRPRLSQLSAWASNQDEPLTKREDLEKKVEEFAKKFEGKPIPLPPNWGGFRLIPTRVEFWQGRKDRLHDRFVYTRLGNLWEIERLSP